MDKEQEKLAEELFNEFDPQEYEGSPADWRAIAKHVLIRETKARIEEIEKASIMKRDSWDLKELSYRYQDRIADLTARLKELEAQ